MAKDKSNRRRKVHEDKRTPKVRRPKPEAENTLSQDDLAKLASVRLARGA